MYQNASTLNGYFAVFEDNSVELEADTGEEVDKVYNNIIITSTESFSPSGTDSIIIKSIPSTFINDIQSIVLYYRTNVNTGRILNLQFELYNSVNDPNLTQILAQTPTTTSIENSYRYDFPSFDTYTLGTTGGSSNSQITSGGLIEDGIINTFDSEVNITGNLTSNSLTTNQLIVNDALLFDTIVIRRPTGVGTGRFTGIREVQLFVNAVNVLPDLVSQSTFDTDGTPLQDISNIPFFIDWSDKTLDPHHAEYYPSKVVDEIIDTGTGTLYSAYWGIREQTGGNIAVTNTDIGLYLPMSAKIDIKDIQSAIIYNRQGGSSNSFVGCAMELYNRSNDPNLETPLSSTNIITETRSVYRYDYPAIGTYPTGDFSNTDSITNIASETLALREVVGVEVGTTNIITELGTKQPTIEDGDLTIAKTDGLQTALNEKQATITSATDLTSKSLTTGNITSPKFRVVKVVENLDDIFPTAETDDIQELATITTFGGTLKFDFDCNGSSTVNTTFLTYTFSLMNASSVVIASTIVPFYFSHKDYHFHFGSTDVYTGISAGTYILLVTRSSTNLRHGADDNFNVCLTEFPF